uniref:Intercellular adhesion molecule N-terminal domain-containing protein n=1 Tax=Cairina moschata TaxID=8855 RepID=A0A8C3GLN2_CAIMO
APSLVPGSQFGTGGSCSGLLALGTGFGSGLTLWYWGPSLVPGFQFGDWGSCFGFWAPGFGEGALVWFRAPSLVPGSQFGTGGSCSGHPGLGLGHWFGSRLTLWFRGPHWVPGSQFGTGGPYSGFWGPGFGDGLLAFGTGVPVCFSPPLGLDLGADPPPAFGVPAFGSGGPAFNSRLPFWGWGLPLGHGPRPRWLPPGGALTGAARGTFTVRAWPQVAVVPFGGSVAINCSHSACPAPETTLGLETSLTKNAAEAGGSWQKFVLVNVSEWSPRPAICHATCGAQRATVTATILVYRVPERVVLEPVPAVAVGESLNLTCRVAEAAPLANLTVTLRRGGETLRTQSFGAAAAGSASVAVSHLLTVGPGDQGQDVSCCFNLSLAPRHSFSNCSAVPIQLTGNGEDRRCSGPPPPPFGHHFPFFFSSAAPLPLSLSPWPLLSLSLSLSATPLLFHFFPFATPFPFSLSLSLQPPLFPFSPFPFLPPWPSLFPFPFFFSPWPSLFPFPFFFSPWPSLFPFPFFFPLGRPFSPFPFFFPLAVPFPLSLFFPPLAVPFPLSLSPFPPASFFSHLHPQSISSPTPSPHPAPINSPGHRGGSQTSPGATPCPFFPSPAVPKKVMLELVPQMAPGKNYTVTCQVESDGVIHNLTVTLCRGREKLAATTFPQTPSMNVSYIITARKQDHGENLTCQASGPRFNRTSAPVTMEVVGESPGAPRALSHPCPVPIPGPVSVFLSPYCPHPIIVITRPHPHLVPVPILSPSPSRP